MIELDFHTDITQPLMFLKLGEALGEVIQERNKTPNIVVFDKNAVDIAFPASATDRPISLLGLRIVESTHKFDDAPATVNIFAGCVHDIESACIILLEGQKSFDRTGYTDVTRNQVSLATGEELIRTTVRIPNWVCYNFLVDLVYTLAPKEGGLHRVVSNQGLCRAIKQNPPEWLREGLKEIMKHSTTVLRTGRTAPTLANPYGGL